MRLWSVNGTYAFSRSLHDITLIIALNTSDSPQDLHVHYDAQRHPHAVFGEASDMVIADGRLKFKIPARSGVVLK